MHCWNVSHNAAYQRARVITALPRGALPAAILAASERYRTPSGDRLILPRPACDGIGHKKQHVTRLVYQREGLTGSAEYTSVSAYSVAESSSYRAIRSAGSLDKSTQFKKSRSEVPVQCES